MEMEPKAPCIATAIYSLVDAVKDWFRCTTRHRGKVVEYVAIGLSSTVFK